MRDPQKTARVLTAGLFGAIPGWVIGLEGADFLYGVGEPVYRQLQQARLHHTPGSIHPGPLWHQWVSQHAYLPTHWLSLFHQPDLLFGATALGLMTGGFLAYQAAKAGRMTDWGGPQAAGKGQHGTAHWRTAASLGQSYTHWQAPLEKNGKSQRLKTIAQIRQDAQDIAQKWEQQTKQTKKAKPADPKAPIRFPPVGLLVGTDTPRNPRGGWILERDEHALILGSTRSGKSRRLIIPSIGIIGSTAQESLVISDPKGEIYDHTADWLQSRGYAVIRLDLIDAKPGHSARYNPLALVWTALHPAPRDPAFAAKVARQVAHLIVYGSGGSFSGTDPLWINGQIALITAVILLVAEGSAEAADCHLAQVYRVMIEKGSEAEGQGLDALFGLLPLDHPARMAYATYQLAQGKTRASIITTAASSLQLFGDPDVAWVTGEQDHDLAQMGHQPTAVFLVIPHDDGSRYTAAALYVNMVFRALTTVARQHHGRLPIRVNALLDEFGNLPAFPDFDQFVTVSAGMGIRLVLALQNIEQLKKHYERTERTIRGNLGTWLFLRTSDLRTAKELSEMMGRYTTHSESTQMPKVSLMSMSTNIGHTSQGLSLTGRELVTADELMRWPEDTVLVWQSGYPPAKLPLPDLSQWDIFPEMQIRHPFQCYAMTQLPDDNAASIVQGGDPPMQPTPDIPRDDLGPLGDLFVAQSLPIDFTDTPPLDTPPLNAE